MNWERHLALGLGLLWPMDLLISMVLEMYPSQHLASRTWQRQNVGPCVAIRRGENYVDPIMSPHDCGNCRTANKSWIAFLTAAKDGFAAHRRG